MDLAQELELDALQLQKPMNNVIDRGDSPVQQFYDGATVFLTGGSGFMGKHLIEKLFRSCAIKKMFLLLRSKKGKTIQERLQFILSDPVYDLLREKQPQFSDRIVVLEGDVADSRLGLSDEDWTTITQEVSVIFHAAATIRFDEPLRVATLVNVRGTRDTLTLARACINLKSIVHVSTAYTSATRDHIGKDVYEKFYPSPVPPQVLISFAEELDEDRLNGITNNFIDGWPNTYTFTKAVAEEQIRTTAKDLPICIVRPPIVTPAFYEPMPGWLDLSAAVSGTSGFYLATILGVLNVLRLNKHTILPLTPVDYVNNAIIAAGWDAEQRRNTGDKDIPIYTVSNKDHYLNWSNVGNHLRNNFKLSTDRAVYACGVVECESHVLYWVLSWLLHYIPAYILDACCAVIGKKPAEIKSFVDIYKKMDKMILVYEYFYSNYWSFHDDNVKAMLGRMSDADKAIYNCDVTTINWPQYILIWGIGIRKYIIKDGINNTEFGYKKQKLFQVVNYVILSLYAYVLYCILIFSCDAVKYVLGISF